MAKANNNTPGSRKPKRTSIGNPKKKHCRDTSKNAQRQRRGR